MPCEGFFLKFAVDINFLSANFDDLSWQADHAFYEISLIIFGEFENNNIILEFQNYMPIVYPQRFGDFISNLSVIDLLFSCGKESLPRIMGNYTNE